MYAPVNVIQQTKYAEIVIEPQVMEIVSCHGFVIRLVTYPGVVPKHEEIPSFDGRKGK